MSNEYELHTPLTEEKVRKFRIGDVVFLSGEIVLMGGLPTHQRVLDYIEQDKKLPIPLENAAVFHFANYAQQTDDGGYRILYVNPTTSTRFNSFTPTFIKRFNLRVIGGKGGLSMECVEAMKRVGCVYLALTGGGCSILTPTIKEVTSANWTDLNIHYRLITARVEKLGPAVIAIDSDGNSMYEKVKTEAAARLPGILKEIKHSALRNGQFGRNIP
jgi:fumarate hydratase subunit beta